MIGQADHERLEDLLAEAHDALDQDDPDRALSLAAEMRQVGGPDEARVPYVEGLVEWRRGDTKAALRRLRRAVKLEPDDPDMRHALALVYEELGDRDNMVRQFIQTRLCDARADREAGLGTPEELDFIEEAAARALERLPRELLSRLGRVPVILERRPSLALVRDGFDPRSFGMFEGHGVLDGGDVVQGPTRILLFTSNLLAEFADPEALAEQVEITVLHEAAHYFGYEEDEMHRLGLE